MKKKYKLDGVSSNLQNFEKLYKPSFEKLYKLDGCHLVYIIYIIFYIILIVLNCSSFWINVQT